MSRFPEASIACLKRVMLSCAPEFRFNLEKVENIRTETGLNGAQIRVWGDHFRMRYTTEKERMDYLTSDGFEKVT
jgi:PP-loop superfamily ATP-utilizing enzyme